MAKVRAHRIRSLFQELKRRRVFGAAGVYIVGAFAVLQAASVVVPALHLADWTMTLLVILAATGFPIAMVVAWVFDIVPGGAGRHMHLEQTRAIETVLPPAARASLPKATAPCVAVMPFLDLSGDADNEVFADGITEDIIAHLSKLRALKVIARNSVMPFKARNLSLREIATQLHATTLLDGSVRRVGDRVRIVAQLIDAETAQHLWAETYDRQLTDIFAIQTDVALQIAAALETELSPEEQTRIRKEPTRSIASYQSYLQGRQWYLRFNPTGLNRAIELFNRAISQDPTYALAYVGIAMASAELVESGALSPDKGRPQAVQAAQEALRLDANLGDAHCAVAHLKSLWEFDWDAAEAGFRRALALNPNSADAHDLYGRMCTAQERYDDALILQHRAQELDPLAHRLDVATTLLRAGRFAEAQAQAANVVEFEPELDRAHATLGWALFKQGDHAHGLACLEHAAELSPHDTQWRAQLGQARALAGDVEGARQILRELEERARTDYISPYHLAFIYTGLNEPEAAMDLLERAFDERAGAIYAIKGSFLFAPLKQHPRFKALLARLNLA